MNWYPFYIGDFKRDTSDLSMAHDGAYRRMLDHCYSTEGPLPRELDKIFRICGAATKREKNAVKSVLAAFWKLTSDGYHNPRVDRQLAKQAEVKAKLSSSGRYGAEKRWKKDGVPQPDEIAHPNSPPHDQAMASRMAKPKPEPEKAAAALIATLGKEVWAELEINPAGLPGEFRELLEGQYATAGGQPAIEVLGLCMDIWEGRHGKGSIPGKVARRASEIRALSRMAPTLGKEMPVLEPETW